MESIDLLEKILKLMNTTADQLTSEQSNTIAEYISCYERNKDNIFRDIETCNRPDSTYSEFICYFSYYFYGSNFIDISTALYYRKEPNIIYVGLDKDATNIRGYKN